MLRRQLLLRSILWCGVVFNISVKVGDHKLLCDFWTAVGERDLTEDAIGKGFRKRLAERNVIREEDDMCYVGGS